MAIAERVDKVPEEEKEERGEGGWDASFIGVAQPSAPLFMLTLDIA
jgi:hypothetical protein